MKNHYNRRFDYGKSDFGMEKLNNGGSDLGKSGLGITVGERSQLAMIALDEAVPHYCVDIDPDRACDVIRTLKEPWDIDVLFTDVDCLVGIHEFSALALTFTRKATLVDGMPEFFRDEFGALHSLARFDIFTDGSYDPAKVRATWSVCIYYCRILLACTSSLVSLVEKLS